MAISIQIVEDFVNGQKAAFDKIYAAYAPGMYGICMRYTRCDDDAKDVLQESFIRIYENRELMDIDKPIGAWIKTITINTALNFIKKHYRFQLTDSDSRIEEVIDSDDSEEVYADYKLKLLKVLQDLPDGYRTIFNLYVIENLTHKEIADHLGISEGTSKSQYFKAKKMIREMLTTDKIAV